MKPRRIPQHIPQDREHHVGVQNWKSTDERGAAFPFRITVWSLVLLALRSLMRGFRDTTPIASLTLISPLTSVSVQREPKKDIVGCDLCFVACWR